MKITVGTKEFASKLAVTAYVSTLLEKYPLGVTVDSEEDHQFLGALLSRHPDHQKKEGCGVAYFSRSQHPDFKSPCFILHRVDGSQTDFSTGTCIKGEGPSLIAEWREACRQAVDGRVHAQKNSVYDADGGRVSCPKTGETLEKGQYWLVQVNPSWSELVDDFIQANALEPCRDDLTKPADNQYSAAFRDPVLAKTFEHFHAPLMNLAPQKVAEKKAG